MFAEIRFSIFHICLLGGGGGIVVLIIIMITKLITATIPPIMLHNRRVVWSNFTTRSGIPDKGWLDCGQLVIVKESPPSFWIPNGHVYKPMADHNIMYLIGCLTIHFALGNFLNRLDVQLDAINGIPREFVKPKPIQGRLFIDKMPNGPNPIQFVLGTNGQLQVFRLDHFAGRVIIGILVFLDGRHTETGIDIDQLVGLAIGIANPNFKTRSSQYITHGNDFAEVDIALWGNESKEK
mmetsp:Transcript_7420/g.17770  ORF Transcript_7420/g.17770 Transcript_7420/m.17770 type:complete len:237 (+) Transcript_7420:313-1023(+)